MLPPLHAHRFVLPEARTYLTYSVVHFLGYIIYLLRLIGHARTAFSIDECVGAIVEENFVPNDRYAALIVEKIPTRQRLQVALTVYQRKGEGDGTKLRYFFDALIPALTEEETPELFDAISEDLRESSDGETLRLVLQLLKPDYWPRLDEVARLRTENRLIRDLKEGRYVRKTEKCLAGAHATWSRGFWPHFTLKNEALGTLMTKLVSSSVESQDYILTFFFGYLDRLADKPPIDLEGILIESLEAGDIRFKRAMDSSRLWGNKLWDEDVRKAKESFQPAEPTPEEDDDVPF
jgi:hypothetical protein